MTCSRACVQSTIRRTRSRWWRRSDSPVRGGLESLRMFQADRLNHTPAALTENFIHDQMLAVQAFGTPLLHAHAKADLTTAWRVRAGAGAATRHRCSRR